MKVKIRSASPWVKQDRRDDVTDILEALRANNPDDAAAAETAMTKRDAQLDLDSILGALGQGNGAGAGAAGTALAGLPGLPKRQEDLASILAALKGNNPDDAAAAAAATTLN